MEDAQARAFFEEVVGAEVVSNMTVKCSKKDVPLTLADLGLTAEVGEAIPLQTVQAR